MCFRTLQHYTDVVIAALIATFDVCSVPSSLLLFEGGEVAFRGSNQSEREDVTRDTIAVQHVLTPSQIRMPVAALNPVWHDYRPTSYRDRLVRELEAAKQTNRLVRRS